MALWGKCLLCNYEDLSDIFRPGVYVCDPRTRGTGNRIPGACWPAYLSPQEGTQHPYVLSTSTGTHSRQRLHFPEGEESPFFFPGLTWQMNSEPEETQIQPATFQFSFIKLHGPPWAN